MVDDNPRVRFLLWGGVGWENGVPRIFTFQEGCGVRNPFMESAGGGVLPAEWELQARWYAGEFGRDFVGTEGEFIRVVQFGVWNRGAGPDFVDAAVSIGGGPVEAGSIELDSDARDW
jgi:hypothetical protein